MALLAGCGPEQRASEPDADINAAAAAAQGDIDTYAANALQPAPSVATRAARPPLAVIADAKRPPPDAPLVGPDNSLAETAARIVDYRCAGDTRISVRFDDAADTATIQRDGRDVTVLAGRGPASGSWYQGDGYELRGTGEGADYTAPGRAPVSCRAD